MDEGLPQRVDVIPELLPELLTKLPPEVLAGSVPSPAPGGAPGLPSGPSAWRQAMRRALSGSLPPALFITSGPPGSNHVCLTFDDGPHPVHTPRVLDALRAVGIRATFFVVGREAERHPALVRRIADEGHDVGHHSYFHTEPALTFVTDFVDEARRTARLLDEIVGQKTRLFRPPSGKLTPAKLAGLWALGQSVVLWNNDPRDYTCTSADEVARRFEAQPLRAGDLVLMHDIHPHAAGAIPALADAVRRKGLAFVPVSEWTRWRWPRT